MLNGKANAHLLKLAMETEVFPMVGTNCQAFLTEACIEGENVLIACKTSAFLCLRDVRQLRLTRFNVMV